MMKTILFIICISKASLAMTNFEQYLDQIQYLGEKTEVISIMRSLIYSANRVDLSNDQRAKNNQTLLSLVSKNYPTCSHHFSSLKEIFSNLNFLAAQRSAAMNLHHEISPNDFKDINEIADDKTQVQNAARTPSSEMDSEEIGNKTYLKVESALEILEVCLD